MQSGDLVSPPYLMFLGFGLERGSSYLPRFLAFFAKGVHPGCGATALGAFFGIAFGVGAVGVNKEFPLFYGGALLDGESFCLRW